MKSWKIYLILFFVCLIIGAICIGIWIFQDAKAKQLNAELWTIICVLVPYGIGTIIYFVFGRKKKRYRCTYCESIFKKFSPKCLNCGAIMKESNLLEVPRANSKYKKYLITYIIVLVGDILTFWLFVFALIGII